MELVKHGSCRKAVPDARSYSREESQPSTSEWHESTVSSFRDKGKNMQKSFNICLQKGKQLLFKFCDSVIP